MKASLKWFSCVVYLKLFSQFHAAIINAFVSKDIKNFEKCPWVNGPSINITHTEDYESITICWRFMTTAYPHCAGTTHNPIVMRTHPTLLEFRIYQPISGMSEDGKQAGWLGFKFNETSEGKKFQVPWRSILFNEQLQIYDWQSLCASYSKKMKRILMFHNGVKYLDFAVDEEHIIISKYFLDNVKINQAFRGSFSDLQVYSKPMDEESLEKWTTCKYDQPGDVYQWDIDRFNLTHDESIISAVEEVDTNHFCKSESSGQTKVHLFGDSRIDPISDFEGRVLCQRLNGEIWMFPESLEELEKVDSYLRSYAEKTNYSGNAINAWVGGVSSLTESIGKSHWYPNLGIYDILHPETGSLLLNEVNKHFIIKDGHTYQKLAHICLLINYRPDREGPSKFHHQKCKRKIIGRVLCEFKASPIIRIKGLCQQSTIDRDFLLIDPKLGEGKRIIKNK